MKFEEALSKMREGAKIRHPAMPEDEYYMACYVGLSPILDPDEEDTFEMKKARGQSIVWMKGDREHPDLRPSLDWNVNACKHGWHPQINLFSIISDEWEIMT